MTDGAPRNIARLSINGAMDPAFVLPADLGNTSVGLASTQNNGRTLLALYGGSRRVQSRAGQRGRFAGRDVPNGARVLHRRGVVGRAAVLATATQADGKILIGGAFNQVNSTRLAGSRG